MVNCPSCEAQFRPAVFNSGRPEPCPLCNKKFQTEVFPALTATQEETQRSETLVDEQAGCYFHPAKKAATVCEVCGRFVCALCDLDINGVHMCPHCLETGKKKGTIEALDNSRMLYGKMALYTAFFSFFISVLSGFLAPITFYIIIRYWKAPGSITGSGKGRFVVAGILALIQILVTFFFFFAIITEGS
ncbi:MAG: hypothetical protein JEZ02_15900 [Desulfatibacillum sp.]|nr:hypothetical protein [Desulfatibacillum sp.]